MGEILLPSAEQIERIIELMGGDEDVYGVEWNKGTGEVIRVAGAKNLTQEDFDYIYPWAGMRRCILNDSGEVVAYFGDPNYIEDGSIGQVMVEIPKFYYRTYRTSNGIRWEISPNNKKGFKVHPAFIGNEELNYIYFSAYEGSIYDASSEEYLLEDEQIADFNEDKLSSIINAKPCSGTSQSLTIVNARKLANNRGEGWGIQDFTTSSAIQLLFLIEYATFNTQSAIGLGVVNKSSGEGNNSEKTGQTSQLGNKSGMADGMNGLVSISYRGIENFWGNIWKWVDGLNIKADNLPYWATHNYESDKFDSQYEFAGGRLSNQNGFVSDILLNNHFDFAFLATETKGSSNSGLADYYYQSTGIRVARFSGAWFDGLYAGGFGWTLSGSSGVSSYRTIGARLLFKSL